jgi:hypothetical protein
MHQFELPSVLFFLPVLVAAAVTTVPTTLETVACDDEGPGHDVPEGEGWGLGSTEGDAAGNALYALFIPPDSCAGCDDEVPEPGCIQENHWSSGVTVETTQHSPTFWSAKAVAGPNSTMHIACTACE